MNTADKIMHYLIEHGNTRASDLCERVCDGARMRLYDASRAESGDDGQRRWGSVEVDNDNLWYGIRYRLPGRVSRVAQKPV